MLVQDIFSESFVWALCISETRDFDRMSVILERMYTKKIAKYLIQSNFNHCTYIIITLKLHNFAQVLFKTYYLLR